jgi:predicted nucleic acid-binding protein
MKRTKIYLDTSVVSMLDGSVLCAITRDFFDIVNQDKYKYELVISPIVINEIDNAKIDKKEAIFYFLDSLNVLTRLEYTSEAYRIAQEYLIEGVLTYNHMDDLLHMAYATFYQCDMIVSWNRKHLANSLKMQKVNLYNVTQGYNSIVFCTPQQFILKLF